MTPQNPPRPTATHRDPVALESDCDPRRSPVGGEVAVEVALNTPRTTHRDPTTSRTQNTHPLATGHTGCHARDLNRRLMMPNHRGTRRDSEWMTAFERTVRALPWYLIPAAAGVGLILFGAVR